MAAFSYNQFKSLAFNNLSDTSENPTIIFDGEDIPICGHVAIVSAFVSNASESPRVITLAIRKADGTDDISIADNAVVPVGETFDLLKGSRVFLNREDMLKVWTDIDGQQSLGLVISYALYTPSDLQPLV